MCHFQDRAGEGVWSLLGKVVTRVGQLVMHAGPAEVMGRRAAVSGREVAIGQAVQGDSGDRDSRLRSQLLLDLVVGRGAGCVSEAMTVGVQHDVDVVGIGEGHRGAVQGGVIEVPVRRVARPDHPRDVAPVDGETGSATLSQEVVEVPEAGFEVGPDRDHGEADVLDEVAVDRDDASTTFRPQRGGDASGAPAPVIAGEDGARDVEGIQQSDHVAADGCLLSRARGGAVQEAGWSMPAQVGGDDTMVRLSQAGDHVDVAMDVVGEPVQEKHDLAVAWTSFEVRNLERISADESQGFEPWQSSAHDGTWVLASHLPSVKVASGCPTSTM